MLSTLNSLKAELQISGTSQDERLSLLLSAASAAIENFCGRSFERETLTERISPRGRQIINLRKYPVVNIASIMLSGQTVSDYQLDAQAGQLWKLTGWTWMPLALPDVTLDPDPNSAERNLTITYTGGYILPGNPGANLPADLQYCCNRIACEMFSRPAGFKSERTPGGYSYEVSALGSAGMLSDVASILEPYRAFEA